MLFHTYTNHQMLLQIKAANNPLKNDSVTTALHLNTRRQTDRQSILTHGVHSDYNQTCLNKGKNTTLLNRSTADDRQKSCMTHSHKQNTSISTAIFP
jgi:hypothetical protein